MSLMGSVCLFQPGVPRVQPGTVIMDVLRRRILAPLVVTSMVLSACLISRVIKIECGMILRVSVCVLRVLSGMVKDVLNVLLGNFMTAAAATAPKEPSSTTTNAQPEPLTNASASPTPTGTALNASASPASKPATTPATATASLSATTVSDAPPNPILSGTTASANATTVMLILVVSVH
jgi:hypothetical protein